MTLTEIGMFTDEKLDPYADILKHVSDVCFDAAAQCQRAIDMGAPATAAEGSVEPLTADTNI